MVSWEPLWVTKKCQGKWSRSQAVPWRSVGAPHEWRKSITKIDHFLKLCHIGQLGPPSVTNGQVFISLSICFKSFFTRNIVVDVKQLSNQGGRSCAKGLRRKTATWMKTLSPNLRYFVAILRFVFRHSACRLCVLSQILWKFLEIISESKDPKGQLGPPWVTKKEV